MLARYIFCCFLFLNFLLACNNSSSPAKETSAKTTTPPADSMSREALFSFVDGCIENAKLTLGQEKAFAFCKCFYEQLRKDNPEMDSVKLKALVNDTAQATKMAENCR